MKPEAGQSAVLIIGRARVTVVVEHGVHGAFFAGEEPAIGKSANGFQVDQSRCGRTEFSGPLVVVSTNA